MNVVHRYKTLPLHRPVRLNLGMFELDERREETVFEKHERKIIPRVSTREHSAGRFN